MDLDLGVDIFGGSNIFNEDGIYAKELTVGKSLLPLPDVSIFLETSNHISFDEIGSKVKDVFTPNTNTQENEIVEDNT